MPRKGEQGECEILGVARRAVLACVERFDADGACMLANHSILVSEAEWQHYVGERGDAWLRETFGLVCEPFPSGMLMYYHREA